MRRTLENRVSPCLPSRGDPCSRRRVLRFVRRVAVVVAVVAVPARAAAADAGTGDEAEDLARSIASQAEALSTDDCAAACKALASMRRATDRLCSLDAGRRCADARARLDDASRKVRAACPTCEVAMPAPPEDKPSVVHAPAKGGAPPPAAPEAASAPPSESRRGGCAGCSGASGGTDAGTIVAVVTALVTLARRTRRRR